MSSSPLPHSLRRIARLITICVTATVAAAALGGPSMSSVDVRVLENTADRVVIQYQVGGYEMDQVAINGEPYTTIRLPHEPILLNAGAPELPHITRSIVIPLSGGVTVSIDPETAVYEEIEGVAIAPSKGNLYRNQNPDDVPYEFNKTIYAADAFYPGTLVETHEPYILRDFRGAVVDVYPFQYNPARRVLRIYMVLTVTVRFDTPVATAERRTRPEQGLSLAFHDLYQTHFINYESQRYAPLDEDGSLLIICHDPWLSNVQPLVSHKNSIGISTTAVGVSTIPGGNNATAIKNYIQSLYNQGNLAFVLLVGDSAQVATPTASGGSSDPSYSKLAGGDNYPDIMVGRFSAETAAHVDTQVQRTIAYETMPATQQAWFWRGVGIGSEQGAGIGDDGKKE